MSAPLTIDDIIFIIIEDNYICFLDFNIGGTEFEETKETWIVPV